MAHFAKINSENIVENIIVIDNEILKDDEGNEVEELGKNFCKDLYGQQTNWVQASYNGNIRKQYPQIGFKYDKTNDVFIGQKPFESWTLDSDFNWIAPISYPTDKKTYLWNEETKAWESFIIDCPFDSWIWNEEKWIWESPIPYPSDDEFYDWNEETTSWDKIK